jgi:hypothetical protein
MNHACEEIRTKIEDSVGRDPGIAERAAIDAHCTACEACRTYRERLIADHVRLERFAALQSLSERRAEERVIATLPSNAPAQAQRRGIRRAFPGVPSVTRIALAAVVVIGVIVGIDFLRDVRNGPVPVFASVVEKMEKAENVIYRDREWILGEWRTIERGSNQAGISRVTYEDSTLVFYHSGEGSQLRMYPAERRAILVQRTYFADDLSNFSELAEKYPSMKRILQRQIEYQKDPLRRYAQMYKREGHQFVRRERRDGKDLAVYEYKIGDRFTWTTWVDVETELPFRVEIVGASRRKLTPAALYGLDVSDFLPAGSPRSAAAGWMELEPGEPNSIYDNFRWNARIDTSYFSLTPPSGYAVTTIDQRSDPKSFEQRRKEDFEQFRREAPYESQEFARALSIWVALSGGAFPDDVRDMIDSSKVKPMLMAKYDKDGVPGDEFRSAFHDAYLLNSGFGCVSRYIENGTFHYFGKGLAFGDSTRIICWGEMTGRSLEWFDNPYWIIYGDLRRVSSGTPPTIDGK